MPRLFVVGDPQQSLYGFRGADTHSFDNIRSMLAANGRPLKVRSLPVNYRCDQAIIERAQKWVPEIRGNSKARGIVDIVSFGEALGRVNNDSRDVALPDGIDGAVRALPLPTKDCQFAFLCRINLPLIVTAYQLIGMGKRVTILGRGQVGEHLKSMCWQLCGKDPEWVMYTDCISDRKDGEGRVVEEGLLTRLASYRTIQAGKLERNEFKNKLEKLHQDCDCLEVIATKVQTNSVKSVIEEIDNLFSDTPEPGVIVLSTVHRAKGQEWEVVFILRPDLMPHPAAKPNADGTWSDEQQQEENIQYVASTRAKHRLYYVTDWPFGNQGNKPLAFDRDEVTNLYTPDQLVDEVKQAETIVIVGEAKPHDIQPVIVDVVPDPQPAETSKLPVLEDDRREFKDDGEPF